MMSFLSWFISNHRVVPQQEQNQQQRYYYYGTYTLIIALLMIVAMMVMNNLVHHNTTTPGSMIIDDHHHHESSNATQNVGNDGFLTTSRKRRRLVSSPRRRSVADSSNNSNTLSFSVMGDVPYSYEQSIRLREQMISQTNMVSSLFVVHVGDIKCDEKCGNPVCQLSDYTNVATILSLSAIPVFILLGDNDWNDCPNPISGLQYWKQTFLYYDTKYWNNITHRIGTNFIRRQYKREENFSFVIQGTLFIGLNLVGGTILDINEWNIRLKEEYNWVSYLIQFYVNSTSTTTPKRIVIFGHAYPRPVHDPFFVPLTQLIQNQLQNRIPILYVHGDLHIWQSQRNYRNQSSWMRISVAGEAIEYPVQITIDTLSTSRKPQDVFRFRRQSY